MFNNDKGQSLVEVVVGLALAILVLGALINAVITSLYNSNFAKSQAEATKLAQQQMEKIRILRDSLGYTIFSTTYGGTGNGKCYYFTGSTILETANCSKQILTPSGSSSTKFQQLIRITNVITAACGSDCSEIKVSVYWADSNCAAADKFCHKSELSSFLSKW